MKLIFDILTARRKIWLNVSSAVVVFALMFSLASYFTSASASAISTSSLCGNGSAPDYGFTYHQQQAHWTIGWQNYASEVAVIEVDEVLDRLNADLIAQTMILILPQDQVGNRVNCAVHFLRYMQLGQPDGERKDNGFVFLIVVDSTRIDVHYGVGLGLPALTASELTELNRTAEEAYQTNQSLDAALLTLVNNFDSVARNKYTPLIFPTPTFETITLPPLSSGNLGILTVCGLLCLGIIILLFLVWLFSMLARSGITFNPPGSGSSGMGNPFGGSNSGPSSRGGSGSGRSGRGN